MGDLVEVSEMVEVCDIVSVIKIGGDVVNVFKIGDLVEVSNVTKLASLIAARAPYSTVW
jgi:hypothetical protein